tara:strand:+ start:24881 stop:25939 length:1059 start_codon:yes stop_codon:yes gene_type:complete
MPLQSSGQITARDIANEFGYSRGSTDGIRIGDYRGQGFTNPNNTTVRIPTSENVTNDLNGSVRFSDFYGGRLTLVVNYFSLAAEYKPNDAYTRFDGQAEKTVVSGFKKITSDNTAGKRVVILVNEDIGSDKIANNSCALRTGTGWNADTVLQILVGPDGEILGAGGDGGAGRSANSGLGGGAGSSGLGVQFEGVGGTGVVIQSGGKISGGAGGGGAGGGAIVTQERFWGEGSTRRATGGSGGGGAGLPAGTSGANRVNGGPGLGGSEQGSNPGAEGGTGGNGGGISGTTVNNGSGGTSGGTSGSEQENPAAYGGGGGGAAGAAIRRTVTTVNVTNLGPPSQLAGSTVETGVT